MDVRGAGAGVSPSTGRIRVWIDNAGAGAASGTVSAINRGDCGANAGVETIIKGKFDKDGDGDSGRGRIISLSPGTGAGAGVGMDEDSIGARASSKRRLDIKGGEALPSSNGEGSGGGDGSTDG